MKREDDEKLWDLLGRKAGPDMSPFFARDVLRRIRQEPPWSARLRSWFRLRRLLPLSGLAAAVVAVALFVRGPGVERQPAAEPDVVAKIDAQDYEVVADLDDLLASDENTLWDDNSSL